MFAVAAPLRRLAWLVAVVVGMLAVSGPTRADAAQNAQRAAFEHAYATAKAQGGDAWRSQAQSLRDYMLYPYLEAAALKHDLRQLALPQVQDYLRRYPGSLPAQDLRRSFLYELARRQDWAGFSTLYQPGQGDALSCDALRAGLAGGARLDFQRDLAALWAKPSLPNACDDVLSAAHDQGLLTAARLWARIDTALDAGRPGTVESLATWLPDDDRPIALAQALALRDPAAAVSAAAAWPDSLRYRQATAAAVSRLARRQPSAADAAWNNLHARFAFTPVQSNEVLAALALYHATDFDPGAMERLTSLPPSAQTDATREWRVRVALAAQDWPAVLVAIDALSADQRDDGEWRYFKARALAQTGQADAARQLYGTLAEQPNYFGFLAADRLGDDYALCPAAPPSDPALAQSLLSNSGLQRAFELYAVHLPALARREWTRALAGSTPADRREAALLAYQRGWLDRSVFIFSSGQALRYYDQRFPLATEDDLVTQAQQAGIEPAWAYGILRAESAWMSDAHSGADARGLMQLLPGTGALVARTSGLPWNGAESLYDPRVNVMLGTRYLGQMAARFNGAPWLASAAYNAGPVKVDQWLAARPSLPPDVFTATIPYKETREYVTRVMAFAVIYDWRLDGSVVPLDQRMSPIGQIYVPPGPGTVRRAVTCPSAKVPATRMAKPPAKTQPVMPATPLSSTSSS